MGDPVPGPLLKRQIPIRTFTEWDNARPGFLEIDLVGHDGGVASGDFCQTLDVTDVASGWTETQAVLNKAQVWVFQALKDIRVCLPFALLGIDSDNVLTAKSSTDVHAKASEAVLDVLEIRCLRCYRKMPVGFHNRQDPLI